MSKLTPGKWIVDRYVGGGWYVLSVEREPKMRICQEPFYEMEFKVSEERDIEKESLANAHLIAAAPEMYRVLEQLLRLANDIGRAGGEPYPDEWIEAWDKAERILRKAKGGAG